MALVSCKEFSHSFRNQNHFFLQICIALALFSCESKAVYIEPDQIGRQVFEILKKLNVKTKAEYMENFMTIDELREMAKNMDLPLENDLRNELTSTTKITARSDL